MKAMPDGTDVAEGNRSMLRGAGAMFRMQTIIMVFSQCQYWVAHGWRGSQRQL